MSRELVQRLRSFDDPYFSVDVALSEAADLIERQAEALEWALAEIEGKTRYDNDRQYENRLSKLRSLTIKDTEE